MAERKALERTSWWEREQTSIGNMLNHWTSILDMDKKIDKVDDLLAGTDGIASINYTSQATSISDLASAIGDLTAFISQIDAELSAEDALFTSSLANGATEEISVIDIEKFTTDNTFDLEETSSMSWGGATVTSNTVKSSLSFSDFLGYSNGSDAVSQYVQGFSDIYKKIYEANKDDYDNIDDFLKTLVHSGEFAHNKDQPMLQFLSDVADVVSLGLKPLIECVTGYNVITGETLSEVEKQMRGIEGLASLGILALTLASGGMAGGVSGILKTLLIDVASGSASVATKSIAKEMGASDGVAMVLGVFAGFTVSRIGTKIMLQMGDVTIEASEEVIRSLEDQIPEVKEGVESSLNGISGADDVFRKNADPFKEVLGSGKDSHPREWEQIIKKMQDNGVEIVYREGGMAYSPLSDRAGQLIIDESSSYAALLHEYTHYLDDVNQGFPGMSYHFQTKNRLQMELHAYMQEIKLADEMGYKSVANELFENYMKERSLLTDYLRSQ